MLKQATERRQTEESANKMIPMGSVNSFPFTVVIEVIIISLCTENFLVTIIRSLAL